LRRGGWSSPADDIKFAGLVWSAHAFTVELCCLSDVFKRAGTVWNFLYRLSGHIVGTDLGVFVCARTFHVPKFQAMVFDNNSE
jgi:hypothetical protein